jgi:hypothetical protein
MKPRRATPEERVYQALYKGGAFTIYWGMAMNERQVLAKIRAALRSPVRKKGAARTPPPREEKSNE